MNIKQIKEAVELLLIEPQSITPYIHGKPGVGKSAIMAQIAKEKSIGFIDLRLSQLESADIRGIPIPDTNLGSSKWLPPETIPFESFKDQAIPGDENGHKFSDGGILFLDEFNRARFDVLQAAFQLVLDRRVGLHKMLDNWFIVCSGNLGEADNTEITEINDAALNNRFAHFTVDDAGLFDVWMEWAQDEAKGNIDNDVIGFLTQKPSNLYIEPQEGEEVFCTPRSWEKFSKVLKQNKEKDPSYITRILGNAIIGPSSLSFLDYLKEKSKISPEDIINKYNKIKYKLKNLDRSRKYSIANEVSNYLSEMEKIDNKQLENLNDFVNNELEKDHMIAIFKSIANIMSIEYNGEKVELIDAYLDKFQDMNDMIYDILAKSGND
jgi:hypothetical protein